METTFAKWLAERGLTHSAFALQRGYSNPGVARLAGIGRVPYLIGSFDLTFLAKVSSETGIPITVLIEDAILAADNPRPPRAYNRRKTNGATQAAE